MYQKSNYCTFEEYDRENTLVYNCKNRKTLLLKNNIANDFINDRYESLDEKVISQLFNSKMLVRSDINEKQEVVDEVINNKFRKDVYYLTIEITLECNFRCYYCYQSRNKEEFTFEDLDKLLLFIGQISKECKKLFILWFGGEPLLEMDKITYLSKRASTTCKENNCELIETMTSNGYLLDEKLNEIKKTSICSMQITVDGCQEEHNKRRTHKKGLPTYEKILKNIKLAIKEGIHIILRINVDVENEKDIIKLLSNFTEEEKLHMICSLSNIFQNKERVDLFPYYKKAIEMGYEVSVLNDKKMYCEYYNNNSLLVRPNLEIATCSLMAEEHKNLAHIDKYGELVITDKLYNKFKTSSINNDEKCKECIYLPVCLGGCPYSSIEDRRACYDNANSLSINQIGILQYIYNATKSVS